MNVKPKLSICIPTNGVLKWVIPVLDSIYHDNVETHLFEVVVTDNGNDDIFRQEMIKYSQKVPNLIYERTEAFEFLNEIEAYKRASGDLIKFVNHRTLFKEGTLQYLVDFADNYREEKPIIYFSNGQISELSGKNEYDTFDLFVRNLSYISSWSTGMCFWKEDFDSLPNETIYNTLFPHTTILFSKTDRNKYIIDNDILLEEMPTGTTPKGRYDLFYAFAVEYLYIILHLRATEKITTQTFLYIKEKNLSFISLLYLQYIVLRRECSYNLSTYDTSINVFYSKNQVNIQCIKELLKKIKRKIIR